MSSTTDPVGTVTVKKQVILDMLQTMPDEFDPEELMYRIYVVAAIAEGEAAIEAGDVLTEEEVDRQIDRWFA